MDPEQDVSLFSKRPQFVECPNTSPEKSPHKHLDQNFQNCSIKDEPLDITEVANISEQDEPGGRSLIEHDKSASMDNNNVTQSKKLDEPPTNRNTIYVIEGRKVVIHGQTKNCILVRNPKLKQNIMESMEKVPKTTSNLPSPNTLTINKREVSPMIRCSRCRCQVHIDSFRQHVCPPTKSQPKQISSKKNDPTPNVDQNQTVRVMYNPSTGEVVTLENNKSKSSFENSVFYNNKNPGIQKNNIRFRKSTRAAKKQFKVGNNLTSPGLLKSKSNEVASFPGSPKEDYLRTLDLQPGPKRVASSPNLPRKMNENVRLNCYICSYSTLNNSELSKHMNFHTQCFICGFRSTPLAVEAHLKKHSENSVNCCNSSQDNDNVTTDLVNRNNPNTENHKNITESASDETDREIEFILSSKTTKGNLICKDIIGKQATDALNSAQVELPAIKTRSKSVCGRKISQKPHDALDYAQVELPLIKTRSKSVCGRRISQEPHGALDCIQVELPAMKIRSKSVCGRRISQKTTDALHYAQVEPPAMKTRSKSVCGERISEKAHEVSPPRSIRTRSKSVCGERINQKTRDALDSAQVKQRSIRTRSKSVCGLRISEKAHEASPPRSIRTRSKSVCANKIQKESNDSEISPRRTRSRWVCKDKIDLEKKSRNLKRSVSAASRSQKSDNMERNKHKKKGTGNHEDVCNSNEDLLNYNSENSPQISNSVAEKFADSFADHQNTFKAKSKLVNRSKNVSSQNNLDLDGKENICKMFGDSNFKSDTETIAQNPNVSQELEDTSDSLLLLQDTTFSCSLCSFTSDKQRILKDHERNHRKTNLPIVQCVYCSQRYTRYMLYLHVQNIHPGQKFQIRDDPKTVHKCSFCSFSTAKQKHLNAHMKTHVSNPPKSEHPIPQTFHCSTCSFSTTRELKLKVHMKRHLVVPVKGKAGAKNFSCKLCSYKCNRVSQLNGHKKSHDNKKPIVKCQYCSFRSTPQALIFHTRKCTKIKKPASLVSEEKLSEPAQVTTIPSIQCSTCSFSTTEQLTLSKHIKENHAESLQSTEESKLQMFKCTMCSYSTKLLYNLKRHKKSHSKNFPILKCANCDFKSMPKALSVHMQSCEMTSEDNKLRSNRSEKEISKDVSSGEYSEPAQKSSKTSRKCTMCFFLATNKVELRLHLKKHKIEAGKRVTLNGITYDCRLCSYTNKNIKEMKVHLNAHKRNIPLTKCQNCNYKSTLRAVRFHMRTCHMVAENKNMTFKTSETEVSTDISSKESAEHIQGSSKSSMKCTVCSFSATDKIKLKLHLKEHIIEVEKSVVSRGTLYECQICSYTTRHKNDMTYHLNVHKKNLPIWNCPKCSFKSTAQALEHHMLKCKGNSTLTSRVINKGTSESVLESSEVSASTPILNIKSSAFTLSSNKRVKLGLRLKKQLPEAFKFINENWRAKTEDMPSKVTPEQSLQQVTQSSESKEGNPATSAKYEIIPFSKHEKYNLKRLLKANLPQPVKHKNASGGYIYSCKTCSHVTIQFLRALNHVKAHSGNLPIVKCDKCSFKSTLKVVKYHMRHCKDTKNKPSENITDQSTVSLKSNQITSESTQKFSAAVPSVNAAASPTLFWCTQCKFSTPLRIALKLHIKKNHLHKCGVCSYVTEQKQYYEKHMHGHARNAPIKKCPHCSFRSTNNILRKHLQKTHGGAFQNLPQDDQAKLTHQKIINSDVSDQEVTSSYRYKCSQCSFSTSLRIKLNSHRKKYHQEGTNVQKMFKCTDCSYVCMRQDTFLRHVETHKKDRPIRTCGTCDYRSTPGALRMHVMKCNGKQIKENTRADEREVPLESISEGHSNRVNVSKGGSMNEDTQELSRDVSDRDYSSQEAITDIRRSSSKKDFSNVKENQLKTVSRIGKDDFKATNPDESNIQKYTCTVCNRSYLYKHNLESHWKKRPTHRKKLKSNQSSADCVKRNQKSVLNIAIIDQKEPLVPHREPEQIFMSAPGIYSCDICSYTTKSSNRIRDHHNAHRNGQSIKKCVYCSYKATPRALFCHVQTCQNTITPKAERTNVSEVYSCNICSFTTHRQSSLTVHLNYHAAVHAPVKKCSNCDFKGTKHVLAVHGPKCPNKTTKKVWLNCSECPYSTCLPKILQDHIEKKHPKKDETPSAGVKSYKCEYCSFTSFWRYLIERHMNSHTLLKLPIKQCEKCDFRSTPAALHAHVKTCVKGSPGKESTSLSASNTKSKGTKRDITGKPKTDTPSKATNNLIKKSRKESSAIEKASKLRKSSDKAAAKSSNNSTLIDTDPFASDDDNDLDTSRTKGELSTTEVSVIKHLSGSITNAPEKEISDKHVSANNINTPEEPNASRFLFRCPRCPFSSHLRIKLKFHLKKKHLKSK